MKKIVLLFCFNIIYSCSSSSDFHNINDPIKDGKYCANIKVKTNKSTKTYQLTITTKNNYLHKIDWPNGDGWIISIISFPSFMKTKLLLQMIDPENLN